MNGLKRVAVALVLVAATAAAAQAQNAGMPLFTNPHYGTGMRIFVDAGQPADEIEASTTDATTVQGGLGFTLGRFGVQALVAGNFTDLKDCEEGVDAASCDDVVLSGAALAGLRLLGGGQKPLAVAVFGGIGTDFSAAEVALNVDGPKRLQIPLGVSVGYKLGPVILWAAPRINLFKLTNCEDNVNVIGSCSDYDSNEIRWAVGANLPLGPLGIRAAYDSGKYEGETVSYFGLGVSLGIGSQN